MAVFEHLLKLITGDSEQNAERLGDRLEKLGTSADRSTKKLDEAGQEAERLGKRAGDTASNAGKLTGALDRVSPQLGDMARFAADAADGLEVASQAGASLVRILGPVAVAVGVAAAAYVVLKQRLDEANTSAEEAVKKADAMTEAHRKVKEAALLAALANGELTQEQYNQQVSARTASDLFKAQREELEAQRRELTILRDEKAADVAATAAQIERNSALVKSEDDLARVNRNLVTELQQAGLAQVDREQKLAAVEQQLAILGEAEARYAKDLETSANAPLKAAAALEAQRDAAKEQSEAIKQLTADLAALASMYDLLPRDKRLETLRGQIAAFAPQAAPLDARTQAGLLRADLAVAASQGRISAAELTELEAAIEAGMRAGLKESAEAQRAAAAAQAEAAAAQRQAAIQTLTGALTGDPSALLSLAGGGLQKLGGALIGGGAGGAGILSGLAGGALSGIAGPAGLALSGLAQVGELGPKGVRQQATAFKDAVVAGIKALPEILTSVIPAFVKAMATELPPALAEALVDTLRRMLEGLLRIVFPRAFENSDGRVSGQERQDARDALAASAAAYEAATAPQGGAALGGGPSAARSARSLRLAASTRGLLAASRRGSSMRAGIVAPTFNALSADDRFMIDATERIARLTDPATGLRRGGA